MQQDMFGDAERHRDKMHEEFSQGNLRMALLETHRCLYDTIDALLTAFNIPTGRKGVTDFHDDLSKDVPSLWKRVEQELQELSEEEKQQYRGLFLDLAFLNRILAASRQYLDFGIGSLGLPGEDRDGRLQGIVKEIVNQVDEITGTLIQLHESIQSKERRSG